MKRDFDTAAKTWDKDDARAHLSLAIADAMIDSLKITGGETVLDYGTGTGTVALRFQPHVKRVIAADSSVGMLEVLKEKLAATGTTNVERRLLDLESETPTEDLAPDIVVSAMAMHHIKDTARFARSLHELLADEGRIALADLDTETGDFHADKTGVEHFGFDREALAQAFRDAGFGHIQFRTAYEMTRPNAAGVEKRYSIFLLTAAKA